MGSKLMQSNGAASVPSGPSIIDTIIYLASLVSKPSEVDDILQPLRFVTASLGPTKTLTPGNVTQLNQVQTQLEDYLVHREPFQKFTPETLHARVVDHFDSGRAWRRFSAAIKLTAYSLAILGGLALIVAQILRIPGIILYQQLIDVLAPWVVPRLSLLGFVALGLGSLGFLAAAFRNIQTRLRPILALMGLAVSVLTVALVTTPLLGNQLPHHQVPWVTWLFAAAAILIMIALEQFLVLLKRPATPRPMLAVGVALTLIIAVLSPIFTYPLTVVWAALGIWRCSQVIAYVGLYFQQALRPLRIVLATLGASMLLLGIERLGWTGDVAHMPMIVMIVTYLVTLACAGLCVQVGRRFDQAGRM